MRNFNDAQFCKFRSFIYEKFGIILAEEKKQVLENKIHKLMNKYNISSYDTFINLLCSEETSALFLDFVSQITINKTDFFREMSHFEFIKRNIELIFNKNSRIRKSNEIRVWSSACSSGQEPYTIAMVLKETLPPDIIIKILATDIDSRILFDAQTGVYPLSITSEVELHYLDKYFEKVNNSYMISDEIKSLVTFRLFNLMNPFPFKNTFDIIFCRNVMIYFDFAVQQKLFDKFYEVITPGGVLFIGHSESLTGKNHQFKYIEPTIYMK